MVNTIGLRNRMIA